MDERVPDGVQSVLFVNAVPACTRSELHCVIMMVTSYVNVVMTDQVGTLD